MMAADQFQTVNQNTSIRAMMNVIHCCCGVCDAGVIIQQSRFTYFSSLIHRSNTENSVTNS